MIVVGIIGILVSMAGPQYRRYQNKARQSEAKLAMGAIYALEKSFYAEYSAYICSLDAIGYAPEGNKRWYDHGITSDCAGGCTVTGYAGAMTVGCILHNMPMYTRTYVYTNACSTMAGAAYGADSQVFTAWAAGNLGNATYDDLWTINQTKVLSNCSNAL